MTSSQQTKTNASSRSLSTMAAPVAAAIRRHPRRVSAAVLALLAGSAMTAFGVAPLTSLPEAPVVVERTEPVAPAALPAQIGELDKQTLTLYRHDTTRQADTADTLLRRLGVDDATAAELLRRDPVAGTLLQGRAGKSVSAIVDNGRLRELIARGPAADSQQSDSHFTRLTIRRDAQAPEGWVIQSQQVALEKRQQWASGRIQSSLYAAADDANIPDSVTNQVAEMFSSDIDFRRELRKGDTFSVLYEAMTADGEAITWFSGTGRVLAARFINQGKAHDAIWFQASGNKGAYYDANGRSKNRAFLASPLAFSRVTSGFSIRFHPILKTWRAHLGVDFGAPTGTPVRSVGDGVVSFAGQQNGYGNVVQIEHNGNRQTVYAHLSRIDVRKGQHIEQGQLVGAVGATGWATGPHLHFEFKLKGTQVDPMTVARASEALTLSPQALGQFKQQTNAIVARLDQTSQWATANASPSAARFE